MLKGTVTQYAQMSGEETRSASASKKKKQEPKHKQWRKHCRACDTPVIIEIVKDG